MAEPKRSTRVRQQAAGLPTTVSELWDLVLAYAKQETLDPLKALGRFVGFGVAGSVLLVIGTVMLGLAALRAIQTETTHHLTHTLSWAPYLAVVVLCVAVAGLAVSRIGKIPQKAEE